MEWKNADKLTASGLFSSCMAMDTPSPFVVTAWRDGRELLQLRHDLYSAEPCRRQAAVSKVSWPKQATACLARRVRQMLTARPGICLATPEARRSAAAPGIDGRCRRCGIAGGARGAAAQCLAVAVCQSHRPVGSLSACTRPQHSYTTRILTTQDRLLTRPCQLRHRPSRHPNRPHPRPPRLVPPRPLPPAAACPRRSPPPHRPPPPALACRTQACRDAEPRMAMGMVLEPARPRLLHHRRRPNYHDSYHHPTP